MCSAPSLFFHCSLQYQTSSWHIRFLHSVSWFFSSEVKPRWYTRCVVQCSYSPHGSWSGCSRPWVIGWSWPQSSQTPSGGRAPRCASKTVDQTRETGTCGDSWQALRVSTNRASLFYLLYCASAKSHDGADTSLWDILHSEKSCNTAHPAKLILPIKTTNCTKYFVFETLEFSFLFILFFNIWISCHFLSCIACQTAFYLRVVNACTHWYPLRFLAFLKCAPNRLTSELSG